MDINRNHFMMIGVVLLIMGVQFRSVDAFVIKQSTSQFVAKRLKGKPKTPSMQMAAPMEQSAVENGWIPESRRTLRLPRWLGLALISVGAVLILNSLVMRKPSG